VAVAVAEVAVTADIADAAVAVAGNVDDGLEGLLLVEIAVAEKEIVDTADTADVDGTVVVVLDKALAEGTDHVADVAAAVVVGEMKMQNQIPGMTRADPKAVVLVVAVERMDLSEL